MEGIASGELRRNVDPDDAADALYALMESVALRVLLGVEDPEISQEYYRQVLGPLLEYDKENGTDLTDVLRGYLDHNGSVRDTAADLFVHRNTVNYKIAKAGDVLGMDLSRLKNRMQLMLGYMLMDMM